MTFAIMISKGRDKYDEHGIYHFSTWRTDSCFSFFSMEFLPIVLPGLKIRFFMLSIIGRIRFLRTKATVLIIPILAKVMKIPTRCLLFGHGNIFSRNPAFVWSMGVRWTFPFRFGLSVSITSAGNGMPKHPSRFSLFVQQIRFTIDRCSLVWYT